MFKKFECVFFIFLVICLLQVRASISPEEVPLELKFALEPELAKWEPPERICKKLPFMVSGYDEENRAIWVLDIGTWEVAELVSKGPEFEKDVNRFLQKFFQLTLDDINLRSTPEKPINQINVILDMDQFLFRNAFGSVKAARLIVDMFSNVVNAAPFTNMITIVNANFFAKQAVLFLKPVLGKTFEKLEVFGTNPNSWIPVLLKQLPKDQLPPRLGGGKNFKPAVLFCNGTLPRIF